MTVADRHPFLLNRLEFLFPLTETHSGIPLSNGTFGALIWGEGRDLRITINRQDYWDHRGGLSFGPEASYENLKRWLAEGDDAKLREAFEGTSDPDLPPRPTRLPMGRIDLVLPEKVVSGGLQIDAAVAEIEMTSGGPPDVRAVIIRDQPILAMRIPAGTQLVARPVNAPEVTDYYRQYGLPPASEFEGEDFGGWVQECPGEKPMCAAWLRRGDEAFVTSVFASGPEAAREYALEMLETAANAGYARLAHDTEEWWREYWERTAAIDLPDSTCELLYYLGMYKLPGLSWPGAPAATLQGPWVEEYRMPPWSSDYHFNINVQECYWPAYGGNQLESLLPLFDMVKSWEPLLRENARLVAHVDDGLMLPHAVDDRGTCMGGFWTGAIDHGSTAWTGQLMWLYYRYTMDEGFLRDTAYPFLKGTMRVYEAMLEDDGTEWALPVSVSPEFGGADSNAWGRNASFQLAIIHFLCRALIQAAEKLGVDDADCAKWRDIDTRLPLGSIPPGGNELQIWDGKPLPESHRHHSHLAGIYPFDIFNLQGDAGQHELVHNSIQRWILEGMGLWTGWCMPWAAIIHARVGNADMAAMLLEMFRRTFLGPGYASTHDSRFKGLTLMAGRPEIMQIEACMGASAAVLELLAHTVGGVLHVFPAMPLPWRDVEFDGLRVEGAFLVSAKRAHGRTVSVHVRSEAGGLLRLADPFGSGEVREVEMQAGEEIVLQP